MKSNSESTRSAFATQSSRNGERKPFGDIIPLPLNVNRLRLKASTSFDEIDDIDDAANMESDERKMRRKMAGFLRLMDHFQLGEKGIGNMATIKLKNGSFLVNPYGMLCEEMTSLSLNIVDRNGEIQKQGSSKSGFDQSSFTMHAAIHRVRPEIQCIVQVFHDDVVALSSFTQGLMALSRSSVLLGKVTKFIPNGDLFDVDDNMNLVAHLGRESKVILVAHVGAIVCGETVEEAFYLARHLVKAASIQLKQLAIGSNFFPTISDERQKSVLECSQQRPNVLACDKANPYHDKSNWQVGVDEFNACMRVLLDEGYDSEPSFPSPTTNEDEQKEYALAPFEILADEDDNETALHESKINTEEQDVDSKCKQWLSSCETQEIPNNTENVEQEISISRKYVTQTSMDSLEGDQKIRETIDERTQKEETIFKLCESISDEEDKVKPLSDGSSDCWKNPNANAKDNPDEKSSLDEKSNLSDPPNMFLEILTATQNEAKLKENSSHEDIPTTIQQVDTEKVNDSEQEVTNEIQPQTASQLSQIESSEEIVSNHEEVTELSEVPAQNNENISCDQQAHEIHQTSLEIVSEVAKEEEHQIANVKDEIRPENVSDHSDSEAPKKESKDINGTTSNEEIVDSSLSASKELEDNQDGAVTLPTDHTSEKIGEATSHENPPEVNNVDKDSVTQLQEDAVTIKNEIQLDESTNSGDVGEIMQQMPLNNNKMNDNIPVKENDSEIIKETTPSDQIQDLLPKVANVIEETEEAIDTNPSRVANESDSAIEQITSTTVCDEIHREDEKGVETNDNDSDVVQEIQSHECDNVEESLKNAEVLEEIVAPQSEENVISNETESADVHETENSSDIIKEISDENQLKESEQDTQDLTAPLQDDVISLEQEETTAHEYVQNSPLKDAEMIEDVETTKQIHENVEEVSSANPQECQKIEDVKCNSIEAENLIPAVSSSEPDHKDDTENVFSSEKISEEIEGECEALEVIGDATEKPLNEDLDSTSAEEIQKLAEEVSQSIETEIVEEQTQLAYMEAQNEINHEIENSETIAEQIDEIPAQLESNLETADQFFLVNSGTSSELPASPPNDRDSANYDGNAYQPVSTNEIAQEPEIRLTVESFMSTADYYYLANVPYNSAMVQDSFKGRQGWIDVYVETLTEASNKEKHPIDDSESVLESKGIEDDLEMPENTPKEIEIIKEEDPEVVTSCEPSEEKAALAENVPEESQQKCENLEDAEEPKLDENPSLIEQCVTEKIKASAEEIDKISAGDSATGKEKSQELETLKAEESGEKISEIKDDSEQDEIDPDLKSIINEAVKNQTPDRLSLTIAQKPASVGRNLFERSNEREFSKFVGFDNRHSNFLRPAKSMELPRASPAKLNIATPNSAPRKIFDMPLMDKAGAKKKASPKVVLSPANTSSSSNEAYVTALDFSIASDGESSPDPELEKSLKQASENAKLNASMSGSDTSDETYDAFVVIQKAELKVVKEDSSKFRNASTQTEPIDLTSPTMLCFNSPKELDEFFEKSTHKFESSPVDKKCTEAQTTDVKISEKTQASHSSEVSPPAEPKEPVHRADRVYRSSNYNGMIFPSTIRVPKHFISPTSPSQDPPKVRSKSLSSCLADDKEEPVHDPKAIKCAHCKTTTPDKLNNSKRKLKFDVQPKQNESFA